MFQTFEATTADDAWQQVADRFRRGGDGLSHKQESRAGGTREILHACLSIADPRQRWVASRTPALNVAFALAEVIWIVRGRNDSAFVNYFSKEVRKYAGDGDIYHGAYGYRLRKTFGIDQLERARAALSSNPDSRQVVLQLWDAKQDFPDPSGREVAPDIPCNIAALLKVRRGRLDWMQVMRSNDVFRGLPYNLVQFTALQEIMAGWLMLEPGSYYHVSDSLHIYDTCLQHIRDATPIAVAPSDDSLALPKAQSDTAFETLERAAEYIAAPNVVAEDLYELSATAELAPAFKNILCVLCAEGSRRRGRRDLAEQLIGCCTNAAYVQLFKAWLLRWQRKEAVTA